MPFNTNFAFRHPVPKWRHGVENPADHDGVRRQCGSLMVVAHYADRSRGILGNNGSVLEVRALGEAGVTLLNASGREGLVTWDTLRDPRSGRIRLSYGDVLTIDATQGGLAFACCWSISQPSTSRATYAASPTCLPRSCCWWFAPP